MVDRSPGVFQRRENLIGIYGQNATTNENVTADWLSLDVCTLQVMLRRLPGAEDITLPIDVAMVVELLNR